MHTADEVALRQERFCLGWMLVKGFAALTLDAKIRTAGWHFMWMVACSVRHGCGRTREGVFHHTLEHALKITPSQFNSSELNSYKVKRYLGFYLARVTLQPRQIQQQATLQIAVA